MLIYHGYEEQGDLYACAYMNIQICMHTHTHLLEINNNKKKIEEYSHIAVFFLKYCTKQTYIFCNYCCCRIKANCPMWDLDLRGGDLSKGPQVVFTRVSEKTTEKSELLCRQVRQGIENGTSCLPALRPEPLGHWKQKHIYMHFFNCSNLSSQHNTRKIFVSFFKSRAV